MVAGLDWKYSNNIQEANSLVKLLYEGSQYKDHDIELSIDWKRYIEMEDAGTIVVFVVREQGTFVGYMTVMADSMLQSKNNKMAYMESLVIHPDHRKGYLFSTFLKFIQLELKEYGIDYFMVHTPAHNDFGAILRRNKFKEFQTDYMIKL